MPAAAIRQQGVGAAWIPVRFASRWPAVAGQHVSKAALKGGHAEHIHANCDCEYAIRFDGYSTVAGYDPEKYLRQYRDAGSDVKSMRRMDYAKNSERINAQKRAAYAARKLSTNKEKTAKIKKDG